MKLFLKTSDHFLTKEPFELHYDASLDMLVTKPRPEDPSKYYESDAYISHSDVPRSFLERLYHTIKKRNLASKLRLLVRYAKQDHSLLDVGAGTAEFLWYAKSRGWLVQGVEPNPTAVAVAQEKGIDLKKELKELPGTKYQVITLWHVLEHLPELKENIGRLASLLKEEGTLIVAVPNYKSFDAKYYNAYWAAYDVPRHLWHFSRHSIQRLFQEHNLEVVETRPMWFDAFYVSLLSETYKKSKAKWIKAFFIGLWSNLRGLVTKEYSSHIYILKKAN